MYDFSTSRPQVKNPQVTSSLLQERDTNFWLNLMKLHIQRSKSAPISYPSVSHFNRIAGGRGGGGNKDKGARHLKYEKR